MDDVTRQAFATAVGVVAAVYIALAMGLEQPYWAALSVMIISNVDRNALFTKGVLRIAGTLVGVLGGFIVALWTEGLPLFQLPLLMLAAGVGTYGRQRSAYGYAWLYGALTFMLIMLCAMQTPEQLYSFAHYRCFEIVIGVAMATLSHWALGPRSGSAWGLVAQPSHVSAHDAMRPALVAALGTATIVLLWSLFELPQLIQVLISSLIIVDSDPLATSRRGGQRILGCLIGGATGLAIIAVDAVHIWWWTASLFLGVFSFSRLHLKASPNAYIGTQSAVALLVTMVGTGPPDSIMPPVNRLVGIVIGVSLMTVLVWAFNARRIEAEKAQEIASEKARAG